MREKKSLLECNLEFEDEITHNSVELFPTGFICDFRWHDYGMHVDDGKGKGELCFNEYGAIVDCRHFEHNDGPYGTMSVKDFKARFQGIVKRLVPKDIYEKYLVALDMGSEGIFKEAQFKTTLHRLFGCSDLVYGYLEPEKRT